LREAEHVDYDRAAVLKEEALRLAYGRFKQSPGLVDEFDKYARSEGNGLRLHALYMALADHFRLKRTGGENWLRWPAEFKNPGSPEVAEFAGSHEDDIGFHMFIQWAIERQLAEASRAASDMAVGLYFDLAVGSGGGGSDTWAYRDVFGMELDTGAPPDDFNPMGQNWMFPPLMPSKLRESGYEVFMRTIRANMGNSGALRIDHALGLFRLFMIPKGSPASEGTYVRYPAEEMLSIIALESRLNGALVVAEDLGLVTEEARSGFQSRGMLSYRLLYFERDWASGGFFPAETYPPQALAAVTTHDLPTLRGWLNARDIAYRQSLGMYHDAAELEIALQSREADKARLLEAVAPYREAASGAGEVLLKHPHVHADDEAISLSAHAMLASTPCAMVSVTLDDLLGAIEQQNIPGTIHEHPNWRRKAGALIEDFRLEGSRARASAMALAGIFASAGRTPELSG
jgi:(1->4)-alpha-D-glucan 1-alpha-D-glucosylmutase